MEYYYDKYKKVWRDVDDRKECSPDKARSLRNARKNKRYIMLENRGGRCYHIHYPGLDADTIFYDIDDFRLFVNDEKQLIMKYKSLTCRSMSMIDVVDIKNKEILKNLEEDMSAVIDYVEDVSYLSFAGQSLKNAAIHNHYWSLSEQAKLYYQIEGNRLDLI